MWRTLIYNLTSQWKRLVITDVIFKAFAFVLLTPTVGLLFRGFLAVSGKSVLADTDIARFFLHPIGWLTLVVVGGATIGVLALEQAALMAISLSAAHARNLSVASGLAFVTRHASSVFQVTFRMVGLILILAAPFLAIGGGLYLLLLTDHDINYYLSEKPPKFWLAVALIGTVLSVLIALLVRCIANWSIAIQLLLFEGVAPGDCLRASKERVQGNRRTIAKWVVTWAAANLLISFIASTLVIAMGRLLVPSAAGHLWTLVLTLGGVVLLWAVVNLGTSLLAVISFALMQAEVYDRFGRSSQLALPGDESDSTSWLLSWTRGRTIAAAVVSVLIAGVVGIATIHSVRLDDDVQITAHRGASAKAPENTLAAVRQAIADRTDWVEIDVQETKDGVVVVAHDSDLMKVSGVATKIWDATFDELQTIDIGSYFAEEFTEERVPTLAEVLEECRDKVNLNIELKYYGHDQNLEQKVVNLVEEYEMQSNVVVMSLKADGIRKVKTLRPDWTVGLLTAVAAGDLTTADADFLAVNTKLATRSFVRSAHAKNKQVYVWTVNDPITMSTMIGRGADNLITDHPDLARSVLNDRAEMSPVERVLLELAFMFGAVRADSSEP